MSGRFAPLPATALTLDNVRIRLRDGLCETAEGAARVELSGDVAAVGLPASLAGPVRCQAGRVTLALAGASGRERLTLIVQGDRVRAEAVVAADDPAVRARLLAAGFVAAGGGYVLTFDAAL